MPVVSHKLRIQGKCDVVELRSDLDGFYFSKYKEKYNIYPIEYKRGKAKTGESDMIQLLAQIMCLEEMLGINIEEGACSLRNLCLPELDGTVSVSQYMEKRIG